MPDATHLPEISPANFEQKKQAPAPKLRFALRLLGYVMRHPQPAVLTLVFGTAGFLLSFVYPWIIGQIVDLTVGSSLARAEREVRLLPLSRLAILAGIGQALVVYGRGHYNVQLGDAVVTDLRRDLFTHVQRLSSNFFARQRVGTLLARILHDVQDATALIYVGIVVAILDAAQLLLAMVLLASISPKLTLACIAVFPLYGAVFWRMNPRVRRASERVREHMANISGHAAERLAGNALVKTYTAEAREQEAFAGAVAQHHKLVVAESRVAHRVVAWGEVLVHLGTTIVIGYGGSLALHAELSAGMLTRFLGYVVILYGPVRRFAELNSVYQSSLSALRNIFDLLDLRPSVVEAERAHVQRPQLGSVTFEAVRFRYADAEPVHDESLREPWILDGLTLHVKPGERIAVVGASGAGKTTLLSLVPRLYEATQGRVLVDGLDVRAYGLSALRSAIGIVQQDALLFTGTIRDNIAYARPNAGDAEVQAAAKSAHAHDFISALPAGYDTQLGERGVNLSGGQRQRISIARALLKDPRILILDEATSSLDADSEAIVQSALELLMRGRTCFICAHRMNTVCEADRIVVLEAGRIKEIGTHRELMQQRGLYAHYVHQQARTQRKDPREPSHESFDSSHA